MSEKSAKERVVDAIRAGKHHTKEQLSKSADVDGLTLASLLGALRREGLIDYAKPHPRAIDYPSMRVVGEGEAKAVAARPRKTRAEKPASTAAAPSSGDGLEECVSVTYQPAEVVDLVHLEAALRTALDKVSELVRALQASPKLGPKGAAAMRLTLMTEAK